MANAQTEQNAERAERVQEVLRLRQSRMQSYHDHKENMAHAGLLVVLGLTAWVISKGTPDRVQQINQWGKINMIGGIVLLWFLLHAYIRWQLRNRRIAAAYDIALLQTLKHWVNNAPTDSELAPYARATNRTSIGARLLAMLFQIIDFFYPINAASIVTGDGPEEYPVLVVDAVGKCGVGAVRGERLVTIASIIMLALMLFRTCAIGAEKVPG